MESLDIQHDGRQRKFFILSGNTEYSLEYNDVEQDLWEFHCNLLQKGNSKEKGIVDRLIDYALNYMVRQNIKILESGSCYQVSEFIEKKRNFGFLVRYFD